MPKYKVEMLERGEWLWVIRPSFDTVAEAQAWIAEAHERDREVHVYRVEEDK